jgi:hypothetical protein
MEYNGWTNYETWLVALHIDNDEGSYQYRCEMAEPFLAPERATSITDSYSDAVAGYADAIQAWVTDELVPDLGPTLASDLLSAALSEVNWREIAENWLSE